MSLYNEWKKIALDEKDRGRAAEFWKEYCDIEMEIYRKILGDKQQKIEGQVKELAEKFDVTPTYFAGFLDGINESIETPVVLEELQEDTVIKLDIIFEKLYFNMLSAKADWLYNLEEWEPIFTEEERKEIKKQYNASKTVVKDEKIGRNDPCNCGSGKKYKKCCGQ